MNPIPNVLEWSEDDASDAPGRPTMLVEVENGCAEAAVPRPPRMPSSSPYRQSQRLSGSLDAESLPQSMLLAIAQVRAARPSRRPTLRVVYSEQTAPPPSRA
jgi:hypothetical protein